MANVDDRSIDRRRAIDRDVVDDVKRECGDGDDDVEHIEGDGVSMKRAREGEARRRANGED